VVFVHDASDLAPAYDVTVSDGMDSQGPLAAAITFTTVDEGIHVALASGPSTTEAGGSVTFDVTLNSQPFADVTISIVSSNPAEGTASGSSLTFTASDWNVAQQVTVTGVNDFVDDGDQAYSIQLQPSSSADRNYNALGAVDVALSNLDDDTAGIFISPTTGLITDESGTSDTFSVVLTSQPLADVVISLGSSSPLEGVLSASTLVFTPDNWNIPVVVSVTGVNDFINDGNRMYQIVATPASSADPLYNGLVAGAVDIFNLDVVEPVLTDPQQIGPVPETRTVPVILTLDEAAAPAAPEEIIIAEADTLPPVDAGFAGGPTDTNELDTSYQAGLKIVAPLFDKDTYNNREIWTDPESQGGLLLRLLEIIQVEYKMENSGHNHIAPALHIEIIQDENFQVEVLTQGTRIAAVSLSVGAVWWALRAGGLFASLLTSLPAWRSFDVLPVLSRDKDEDEDNALREFDDARHEKDQSSAKRPQEQEQTT